MAKQRLDQTMVSRGILPSRSQAENYIKLAKVECNGQIVTKPGYLVDDSVTITLKSTEQYVSRAGLKLASVAEALKLDFRDKLVLDVGSSTGGFTDYALQHGATKVIAVEVGTNQLHPSLHDNPKIELHEQTDVRNFQTTQKIDIVVVDVSFISLREILPYISQLMNHNTQLIAMLKPQFETGDQYKHKGVIKNDSMRRNILKDFENWTQKLFKIVNKADSKVAGAKGNRERFYLLKLL